MLLTEKNNWDVKGRAVLNGKQSYLRASKEDTAIPTADNDIIMITSDIDTTEVRYVIGVDVPNAFIQQ